uniref:Ribosome biogenesis protein WDR12 homolog n=1 Tax=Plectus sambesii TaxID=2011161 RepID=A0A914WDY1_9BILA
MDVEENAVNAAYLQVEFFSNQKSVAIPTTPFAIPDSASHESLNALLSAVLEQEEKEDGKENSETKSTPFDFLIDGTLLRVPLREYIDQRGIGTESVIRIECVIREPAPSPDQDIAHDDWISSVRTTDRYIISGCYDNSAYVWSRSGQLLASASGHTGSVKCLALVGNNTLLSDKQDMRFVTGSQDQTLMLWKIESEGKGKKKLKVVNTQLFRGHERSVECVATNSDGTLMVSGSFDSFLKVWNIQESDESTVVANAKKRKTDDDQSVTKTPMVTLSGHRDAVVGVCWSPTSAKEVITASWDHSIIVWDLELAGQQSSLVGTKSFTSVSVSPISGNLLTGSVDQHVRLWDPRSKEGSMVKQTFTSHTGWVSCVNWSPTKDHLFVSASFDKVLKLWDTRSPKTPLYDMTGHSDRILTCDWRAPELIASGGVDGTVKTFKKDL